jgi:hypothetical protein
MLSKVGNMPSNGTMYGVSESRDMSVQVTIIYTWNLPVPTSSHFYKTIQEHKQNA